MEEPKMTARAVEVYDKKLAALKKAAKELDWLEDYEVEYLAEAVNELREELEWMYEDEADRFLRRYMKVILDEVEELDEKVAATSNSRNGRKPVYQEQLPDTDDDRLKRNPKVDTTKRKQLLYKRKQLSYEKLKQLLYKYEKEMDERDRKKCYWTEKEKKRAKETEEWCAEFEEEHHIFNKILELALPILVTGAFIIMML